MANFISSPNMSLPLPVIGVDPGPDYASNQNAAFTILDGHTHVTGSGVPITTAAININADLSFSNFNATLLRSTRFASQSAAISGASDVNCLYFTGGNLYANDGSGNQIKITSGGGVNATSSGISSGSASAAFSSGVLVVNSASTTPANIQGGSILLGNNVASSNFLTLSPPTLSSNYTLTLPAIPANTSVVTINNSGIMGTQNANALVPTGTVLMYSVSSAPSGYLNCDGSSYSTSVYANLFAVIGYTFGGSGSSFNVPNYLGLFPRSIGTQGSYTGPSIGSTQAQSTAVNGLTAAVSPNPHAHTATQYTNSDTGTQLSNSAANINPSTLTTSSVSLSVSLSGDAETRPGNFGINFVIKT
jgi:microcystin-dependent protein